jgi:hypothetical protein
MPWSDNERIGSIVSQGKEGSLIGGAETTAIRRERQQQSVGEDDNNHVWGGPATTKSALAIVGRAAEPVRKIVRAAAGKSSRVHATFDFGIPPEEFFPTTT